MSVMFCDMVDSTPLAARLGADAMHRVVGEFFDRARSIVQAHDGVVNQFLGDGFMALFGAPLARADHALAACRAGLAIQRELTADKWASLPPGEAVRLRVGLNHGPVVFGRVGAAGNGTATAIGDTANLAARLQAAAAPGSVLASAAILREAGAAVVATALGEHSLKGIPGRVKLFRVEKVKARLAQRAAALVGRAPEVAAMRDVLARLATGGAGLLVLEGDAGIGKSSLLEELGAYAHTAGIQVGTAQCQTAGAMLPLRPVRDALRALHDVDAALPAARSVRAMLREVAGDEARSTIPHALALLGLPLLDDEAAMRHALDGAALAQGQRLAAVRLLEARLRNAPVLLVLDDWHAADHASADLLFHLLALKRDARFAVAIACRSGEVALDEFCDRIVVGGSAVCRVRVAPLPDAAARELVAARLGGATVTASTLDVLLARGAGNPLFLAGLADAVLATTDERLLKPDGTHEGQLSLPGSIEAIVQARIDRLDEIAQGALRAAAVIGRDFDVTILEIVLQRDCDDALAALAQDGLVTRVSETPGRTWRFNHPLTCEVAYASLVADARKRLHARVAGAIEEQVAEGIPGFHDAALAHHRAAAGDWGKALIHLHRIADDAARLAADQEALVLYERVLAAAEAAGKVFDVEEQAFIELALAEALFRLGRHESARQRASAALKALGVRQPGTRAGARAAVMARWLKLKLRGPGRRLASADVSRHAGVIARLLELVGNIDYYVDPQYFALDILTMLDYAPPDSRAAAIGLASVGAVADTLGLRHSAARWHARAAAAGRASGDAIATGYVENLAGLHDYAGGRWQEARTRLEAARGHFGRAGHERLWASATGSLYLVLRSQGDPQWMTLLEAQEERARLVGDSHALAWATNAAGVALQYRGCMEGTRALFEAASARYEAVPDYRFLAGALARRMYCHAWEGDFESVLALSARVEALLQRAFMRGLSASAPLIAVAEALVLGACYPRAAGGQAQAAAAAAAPRAVARAMAHGRKCGDESGVDAHRLAGMLAWAGADRAGAVRHWRAGDALGEARGALRALALLKQTWAEAATDPARREQAQALLSKSGAAVIPPPPWAGQ
ncbi:MAG: ATP-binding protein [Burkholderiales bacterium]